MTAAAMTVLTIGAQQLAIASIEVTVWLAVIAVALAVLLLGLRWCARRRSRVPLQPLPPAHEDTQEIDVPDFMRKPQRHDSVTEAIERWEHEWNERNRGPGNRG
jgi:hypothetical protein